MAIFSGVSTFVAGLFSGGFWSSTLGTIVLRSVASVATNLLVSAILGRRDQPEQPPFSVSGRLQQGESVPRQFPLGEGFTAGSAAYRNTHGERNQFYTAVIAVSDLPRVTLNRLVVNGELTTLLTGEVHADRGTPVSEYRRSGTDHLWIKWYDGTQTVADPWLVNSVSSPERPYSSNRVGYGVAYAIVTARIKDSVFTTWPEYGFWLNPVPLYDVTKDDTAGGVGSHRWDDQSTWGGDGDHLVATQAYNVLRGIYYGSTWLFGMQNMPAARLPAADWRDGIEKCRAAFDLGGGQSEPMFRAGGILTVDSELGSVLEAIMTAGSGRVSEVGGIFKPAVGAPDASVMVIEDEEIRTDEVTSFSPFPTLQDTVNHVVAQYPEPEEGWTMKTSPAVTDLALQAADGNRQLPKSVTLTNVPYSTQVQRLLAYALREARRARRHTMLLPPKYNRLEPNDTVTWSSSRFGYVGKTWRIDGILDMDDCGIIVDMVEIDPAAYDAPTITPIVPNPVVIVRPDAEVLPGFAVAPAQLVDAHGVNRVPAILATWDGDELWDYTGIRLEVREVATLTLAATDSVSDPAAGEVIISDGLLPSTGYAVRALGVSINRETIWSDWLPVTTPDARLGFDQLAPEIRDDIDAAAQSAQDDKVAAVAAAAAAAQSVIDAANEVIEATQEKIEAQMAAASAASKNMDPTPTGTNGRGGWLGGGGTGVSTDVPPGIDAAERSLVMTDGARNVDGRTNVNANGRYYRIHGWHKGDSTTSSRALFRGEITGQEASGDGQVINRTVISGTGDVPAGADWTYVDFILRVDVDTNLIMPAFDSAAGNSGDALFYGMVFEDVTESYLASQSASLATTERELAVDARTTSQARAGGNLVVDPGFNNSEGVPVAAGVAVSSGSVLAIIDHGDAAGSSPVSPKTMQISFTDNEGGCIFRGYGATPDDVFQYDPRGRSFEFTFNYKSTTADAFDIRCDVLGRQADGTFVDNAATVDVPSPVLDGTWNAATKLRANVPDSIDASIVVFDLRIRARNAPNNGAEKLLWITDVDIRDVTDVVKAGEAATSEVSAGIARDEAVAAQAGAEAAEAGATTQTLLAAEAVRRANYASQGNYVTEPNGDELNPQSTLWHYARTSVDPLSDTFNDGAPPSAPPNGTHAIRQDGRNLYFGEFIKESLAGRVLRFRGQAYKQTTPTDVWMRAGVTLNYDTGSGETLSWPTTVVTADNGAWTAFDFRMDFRSTGGFWGVAETSYEWKPFFQLNGFEPPDDLEGWWNDVIVEDITEQVLAEEAQAEAEIARDAAVVAQTGSETAEAGATEQATLSALSNFRGQQHAAGYLFQGDFTDGIAPGAWHDTAQLVTLTGNPNGATRGITHTTYRWLATDIVPVEPGHRIEVSGDMQLNTPHGAGNNITIALDWLDQSGGYLSNNAFLVRSDNFSPWVVGDWVSSGTQVFTAPAGAAFCRITCSSGPTGGGASDVTPGNYFTNIYARNVTEELNAADSAAAALVNETASAQSAADAAGSEAAALTALNLTAVAQTQAARGNLVQTPDGTNGTGDWSPSASTNADVPASAPAGALSLQLSDGRTDDGGRLVGNFNGEWVRLRGWVKSPASEVNQAGLLVRGANAGGNAQTDRSWISTSPALASVVGGSDTWTYLDTTVQVNVDTEAIVPGFDISGTGTGFALLYDYQFEIVTERVRAELAEAAAGVSEVNSATSEANAAGSEAAALSAKEVSARLMSGGEAANPVFSDWPGTYPNNIIVAIDEGTVAKNTTDAKYENAIDMASEATPTLARPSLSVRASQQGGRIFDPLDVDAVEIELEFEIISGSLNSAHLVAWWASAGTGGSHHWAVGFLADLGAVDEVGVIQTVRFYKERDDTLYSPGDGANTFEMLFYTVHMQNNPASTGVGAGLPSNIRVHRFDYRIVNAGSSAQILQSAVADLEGNAAASLILRADAGNPAVIEIASANNPTGPATSNVKIGGDLVTLNGVVEATESLRSSDYVADTSGWQIDGDGNAEFNTVMVRAGNVDSDAIDTANVLDNAITISRISEVPQQLSANTVTFVTSAACDLWVFCRATHTFSTGSDGAYNFTLFLDVSAPGFSRQTDRISVGDSSSGTAVRSFMRFVGGVAAGQTITVSTRSLFANYGLASQLLVAEVKK